MAVSNTFNTSNDRVKYNITVTESNVNESANTSQVTVSVKFWRTNTGYETYGTGSVTCIIDGTTYTQDVTSTQKITNSGIVLFTKKLTINHNTDGSKVINVKAKISLNTPLTSDYQGFNVTLTKINRTPSNIATFNISAGYGDYVGLGDTVTLKWSAATGTVTGYEIQYSRGDSGWKAYKTVSGTSTTDVFTSTAIGTNGAGCAVKYRIRALNGSLASAWKESNTLYISGAMDLKVNNTWKTGSVWVNVGGTWKRAKRVWINVNGTWKSSK